MSATRAGQRQNVLKLQWLKCPNTVQKSGNLDQKINVSIEYLAFGFFLLISDFLAENLKVNKD